MKKRLKKKQHIKHLATLATLMDAIRLQYPRYAITMHENYIYIMPIADIAQQFNEDEYYAWLDSSMIPMLTYKGIRGMIKIDLTRANLDNKNLKKLIFDELNRMVTDNEYYLKNDL